MPNYASDNEVLYHIGLSRNMIKGAKYVLLPGDPGRVEVIAGSFTDSEYLGTHREYTSWLCTIGKEKVLVCSTGMGGPSVAIGLEELARIGVENFIRIGTTGSIQDYIVLGDVIINNAAVRLEGTSGHYLPDNFPAVASFSLTERLKNSADELRMPYHVGISVSSDTFWPGQERHDSFTGYVLPKFEGSLAMWRRLGALNCEMETAALFAVAQSFGLEAASICGVIAARVQSEHIAGKDVYDNSQKRIYAIIQNFFESMDAK